jgi:hypothetical protein
MLAIVDCSPPANRSHVPLERDCAKVEHGTNRQLRTGTAQHPVHRRLPAMPILNPYFDSTFAIGSSLSRATMASAQAVSPA